MKQLEIAIDLDGIAADFTHRLLSEYADITGERITQEQITDWDISKFVSHPRVAHHLFHTPGFFSRLAPMDGAVEGILRLQKMGHDVFIVTSGCSVAAYSEKAQWCHDYLGLSTKAVNVVHEKKRVCADVLIDDGPHNTRAWKRRHPGGLTLGIMHPYNAHHGADFDVLFHSYREPSAAWEAIVDRIALQANS